MSAGDAPELIAAHHYCNVEDRDTLIGIWDWKPRSVWVADPGTREQLLELLAAPMRIVADQVEDKKPTRVEVDRKVGYDD